MNKRHLVAVLMAQPDAARRLAACLEEEGVEPVLVTSSDELHRALNFRTFDAVVIEHALSGFLTGLEILERLYNDLLRPATVLLTETPVELEPRAAKLGIYSLIRPSQGIEAIAAAVKGALFANQHSHIMIPLAARRLVQQCDAIRPLPQVLVTIARYLDHTTASLNDLAKDISVDPKITAELLKLVNSAAMGIRNRVTKVFDAINFLGIRRTVSLIMSSTVIDAQSRLANQLPASFQSWYNSRSVLVASTASAFARGMDDVDSETAYILGLFQELGIVVLSHAYGERYLRTLERVRNISQLSLELCEREEFHFTHADVSAALLQKWGVPQSLVGLVFSHHQKRPTDRSKAEQSFLRVMQIGEAVADMTDKCTPQRHNRLSQLLASYGTAQGERCKACLAEAVARTAESSELFQIPVPEGNVLRDLLKQFAAEETQAGRESAGEENLQETKPQQTRPEKILIVEDDAFMIKYVRSILQPVGLEVIECGTLDDARRLAPQAMAVLVDVHLEGGSGIDIVEHLRRDGFDRPILVMSGDRTRGTVVRSINAGVNDYLVKPFNSAALIQKLNKHTGRVWESVEPTALAASSAFEPA